MIHAFWRAATAIDPNSVDLAENARMSFCQPDSLVGLSEAAGLRSVDVEAIDIVTEFRDFDDFWQPFTLGAGSFPAYCIRLSEEARDALRRRLQDSLPQAPDGSIALKARAWAVRSHG